MNTTYRTIWVLLLLTVPFVVSSQTVNTGELSISPGTQMSTMGALDNKATGDLINDGELFVYSHYNNDGLVSYTTGSTTGKTWMSGTAGFQDISGSMPIEWYNVEFNNRIVQPAFHLSTELSISGQANFQRGIVDDATYNGLLIFEKDASHLNVDDLSHVDGEVRKNGNDAFRYPIGNKGKYRYASISNPNSITDSFVGKYFFENSNTLFSHNNKASNIGLIDNAEYWTIDKTTASSNVFLTLSWNTTTTPAAIYASPSEDLHIVRWDTTSNSWVDEGGVADPASKEVTMVTNTLTKYGVFTLARIQTDLVLEVYNALSPNGDGENDFFKIDGLTSYTDNAVTIFNRWGTVVYETKGYGNTIDSNVFKGISEGGLSLAKNEKLPNGTYFYVIEVVVDNEGTKTKKSGYLYINEK